jgi:hypothetical protein
MKLKNIFWGFLLAAIAFYGCDEIAQPLVQKQTNGTLPSTPPTFRDSSATSGPNSYTNYKVLLEDCMGHLCSNCPPAVSVGDGLIGSSSPFPGQVILMEEHMGHFAGTATYAGLPDSAFAKDYTSLAGNNWLTEFGVNLYPWGMINRVGFPNTLQLYPNWQTTVQAMITANSSPSVTIQIHDSCWVPQRIIGVEFQVTFKKAIDTACNLVAAIIQDSILDWQADNSTFDTNFVHRNVLRGTFDWAAGATAGTGVLIPSTSSSVAGGTWTSYQTYDFVKGENGKAAGISPNLPWNMAHCYIVAFVYNSVSKAVIQAEMIKVE